MMLRVLGVAIAALAVGAASCEQPESNERANDAVPEESTRHAAADPVLGRTAECINHTEGFAVQYPADWHINTDEILTPCSLFDPEPIDIPRNSEIPIEIAIVIDVERVPFTTLNSDVVGRQVLSREQTTVDGREAVRIHAEATGDGLYDRGIRFYQYVVDAGETTMVAVTYDAGSLPFERKRRILDSMMEMLVFRRSG